MKKKDLTKLALVIDVQLAILLGLILYNGFTTTKVSIPYEDVLGTEVVNESTDFNVSVCHVEDCVYL